MCTNSHTWEQCFVQNHPNGWIKIKTQSVYIQEHLKVVFMSLAKANDLFYCSKSQILGNEIVWSNITIQGLLTAEPIKCSNYWEKGLPRLWPHFNPQKPEAMENLTKCKLTMRKKMRKSIF